MWYGFPHWFPLLHGTVASNWPIVPTRDGRWVWSNGGMFGSGQIIVLRDKPTPDLLYPPQIQCRLLWGWTWASTERNWHLSVRAMAWPPHVSQGYGMVPSCQSGLLAWPPHVIQGYGMAPRASLLSFPTFMDMHVLSCLTWGLCVIWLWPLPHLCVFYLLILPFMQHSVSLISSIIVGKYKVH
jgi:hypothetical protein